MKHRIGMAATALWAVLACVPAAEGQTTSPLPELLRLADGTTVRDAATWRSRRRAELLELFARHEYGRTPKPAEVTFARVDSVAGMMGGQATRKRIDITVRGPLGNKTFRLLLFLPSPATKPAPLFLLLNNRAESITDPDRSTPSGFWPAEEVIARGYAVAAIHLPQVTPDNSGTYRTGLLSAFEPAAGTRPADAWGTIASWSSAASRAMDYFERDPQIDAGKVAIVGHSRGGKTTLWAGAQDERIAMVVSNNSGCGGAALHRRTVGEDIAAINKTFPHWFCGNFKEFNDREDSLPFDQHQLVALMAPRLVYITSATQDNWSDPQGEWLSALHASPAYGLFGLTGMAAGAWPRPEEPSQTGRIGYHLRTGVHDLTAYDWQRFLDFADRHLKVAVPVAAGPFPRRNRIGKVVEPEVVNALGRLLAPHAPVPRFPRMPAATQGN